MKVIGNTLVFNPSAGKGTRLMPLTKQQSKPSLPTQIVGENSFRRMIDSVIDVLPDCSHVVSVSYCKHSLEYLSERKNVMLFEPKDSWIESSIEEFLDGSSFDQYEFFLYLPPDAVVSANVIEEMFDYINENTTSVLLCTTSLNKHNLRYTNSEGFLSADPTLNIYGDLGIYLTRWNSILARYRRDKHIDLIRGWEKSDERAMTKIMVREDISSVDIGTPEAFYNHIYKVNKKYEDENHNIVFPGAVIDKRSTFTIALPNSCSQGIVLNRCIVPENTVALSKADVLCLV